MSLENLRNKNSDGTNKEPDITSANNQEVEEANKKAREAEERAANAEFKSGFMEVTSTYPLASEYEDAIKEKVKAGYSVDDATVAVLQKEGKLKTKAEIDRESNRGRDLGGSAASPDLSNRGSDKEPTVDEAAQAFKDAEARGEIKLS